MQVFHDFKYISLSEDTKKLQYNVEIQPEASS